MDTPKSVGVVGLGNMGTAIAERLATSEYDLTVYNRSIAKTEPFAADGVRVAATLDELIARVDVVLTSLSDDAAFVAVYKTVAAAARPGTLLIDVSTVTPDASAAVAALVGAASLRYVRAPVSGNPSVVRAGNLSFIVSGERADADRAAPVMHAIGPTVHYVGAGELARVVKLSINLMVAGLAELIAEALVLGESMGVPRATMLGVMADSAVGAPLVKYKAQPLVDHDFSATFTTTLMQKDVRLALGLAERAGLRLPLASETATLLQASIDSGYADSDFMALILNIEKTTKSTDGSIRADAEEDTP